MSADNNIILQAVKEIKTAILQSRYIAARQANAEQLKLYFAVGGYVSANTRGKDKWGTGVIEQISNLLVRELPGLRGFSASNIKYMRIFFEQWNAYVYSQLYFEQCQNLLSVAIQCIDNKQNINRQTLSDDLQSAFLSVGFSHHIRQVSRAVMAFKDEMLLDFINIEEEQDPESIDERVLEQSIIQNIRKFIQCCGISR